MVNKDAKTREVRENLKLGIIDIDEARTELGYQARTEEEKQKIEEEKLAEREFEMQKLRYSNGGGDKNGNGG